VTIYFYRTNEIPYGALSNFSKHGFDLDGKWWPTVEHYYQAQKYPNTDYAEEIRRAPTAYVARQMGKESSHPIRADWDSIRHEVMERALLRKFEAHEELRDLLLSTGDEEIVENSPYDNYWGTGPDGQGENRFGKMLVHVRDRLRAQATVQGERHV
jgi:N-glycosidase YbiA